MKKEAKKIIVAFDFDGTITTKDTLFDFLFFYFGKAKVFIGLVILSPILISFKLGIIKNSTAKQMLFSYFFKSRSTTDFSSKCELYSDRINNICRKATLKKLHEHQKEGHEIIIISASISNWIKPWALKKGINAVLGTEIEVKQNYITGKFASPNCYGQEKVNRLLTLYPDRNNYILYAYGDSSGDDELLKLADYPTFIK